MEKEYWDGRIKYHINYFVWTVVHTKVDRKNYTKYKARRDVGEMATEGYKQKINVVLSEKLYDDIIEFGLKNDMKFSECVRESERLYGDLVLSSGYLKKNKGKIKKQAKFKKKEYLRIKQTVDINHITIKVYLTACLEFMVYGNSREL
ncbi:hypothetical protein [Anaerocolumna jejuensis]|nr:hypothetical protein [Anaerocolumna jejuensis]